MKRKPSIEVRHCAECRRWQTWDNPRPEFSCQLGHRPRFYLPRFEGDDAYGRKRRCDDWLKRDEEGGR
jgi:hypothetical protein